MVTGRRADVSVHGHDEQSRNIMGDLLALSM